MPDKKYLIEIPGMPEGSGVWDADKWERNKDLFMEDYPDANVFELGEYDADDAKETDQIMLDLGNEDMSGFWDNAKWERNKDLLMEDYPEAKVSRVRYVDYWGQKAEENRAQRALLQQPNEERNARLAEIGYYDDITGGQVDFSLNAPSTIGLKPLSSAVEESATGETTYHDPRVKEFFANDSAETDRQAEIARLDAEYDANPSVIAQREWEAKILEERKAYAGNLEREIRRNMESDVDVAKASRGGAAKRGFDPLEGSQMSYLLDKIAGDEAGSGSAENEKLENYTTALKFMEKAKIARDVAGKGFGGAVVDWTKEGIMDLATQDDVEAYNEIGNILTRLEKKVGSLKSENLTEEVFDKYLTKSEQALIKSFYEYNAAMAEAGQDMSRAYKGGKIFAESVPFMLEFIATGGFYRGAGRAATSWMGKGFAKWIAKSAAKSTARAAKVATTKIVSGAVKAGFGTLGRTIASPGTYDRMAEASIEIDKDGHLNRAKESAVAFADMYVENLSEISGGLIGKGLGLVGKGAAKLIAKTPLSKIGGMIGDNRLMQSISAFMPKLEALGFHGLPEEIGEEFIGNAIRELGIQPGALKEMVSDDNFGAMLIGFAPMTMIGVAGGVYNLGVVNAKAAQLGKDLREKFGSAYTKEELDHMMGVIQNAQTAEEIQKALKPMAIAAVNSFEKGMITKEQMTEQIEMLYQYGGFMAQNNALLFGKKAQDKQMMDAKREEFTTQLGRFWQEDQTETVQVATLNNGSTVFVTSAPAEDGKITIVDAVTGKKGFANVSDIATREVDGEQIQSSNSMTMDAFLNGQIAMQRKTAEETRMNNERNAQIEALAAQITPGTKINLGTEGSPVIVFATGTNKNGVVVVDETGMQSTLGWEQAAYALGQPIKVETDQQKLDAEIADRLQRMAERRMQRTITPATEATAEAAGEAAEVVAQEQQNIPLREDGTVDEALFWTQDPEGYVKWNDEQNKDGGQDSLRQIAISKQELIGMLNEAATGQNTSNPTMRKAAEKQVAAIAEKIARLEALEMSYADALAEEKEAVKQTQATPTATMSEEQLEQMDAQYQGILGKTRIQSERVRVMQEYLDKLAEDSIPAILLTMENYAEVMEQEGCADFLIESVREQVDAGEIVSGFMANGKVFLMAEGLASIESGRVTYVHERQHTFNRANPQLVQRVAEALGSKEVALSIVESFVGKKGTKAYESLDLNGLADEIIAFSMEIVYTTEEFSVDLQSKGVPSEVISIITEIDNEQRQDQSLSHARRRSRRNSHDDVSGSGNMREDGRDLGQISGGVLVEETTRSSETGKRGAQTGSTGEGTEVISEEQLNAPSSGTAQQITAADGEVLADTDGKGGVRFSIRTWNEGGRDYLAAWLANDITLTDEEKTDILSRMDEFYKNALLYSDTYAPFGTWSDAGVRYDNNGNPLMSVIKANGDYAMNLDFSLVCKKRRPLNRLLRTLVNRNAFATYTLRERELAEINWILQEHGFEVACALCFVDSKRYRVTGVADVFAALYNRLVKSLAPEGVQIAHFNYNENPNVEVVENGLDTMSDDQLNWDRFDRLLSAYKEGSVEHKVAQYLREHPEARKLVDATDFIEAEGFESVKENNPDLLKFYNMKKGTGGPKASFGDVQYLNDILKKEKSFDAEKAYAVGGVRLQSFSDFVPHMYFDYMQLFAELAAKKLPLHAYTKEVLFAKIFGLTGAKINMSLVPAVVEGGVAPGLDAEGNYAWADPVTDAEGNVIQQGQSFPYDEAMTIQQAEGYSKNCGVIAVGISDAHIEKMLDDPNIPFIIPYHKSSLNAIVARMTNIDQYKDYTNVQNTRKASGSKLDKGTKDFNFNEYLHGLGESGTPQQAAQAYLDWCRENNYKPKFSQFAYHPNYYKLLQDFNTIDLATGEYAPQGAVTMTFPTEESAFGNVETLIQQGLQEDAELEEKMEQEIDGIADQVLVRLEEISKEPKMSEKQQARKMAELADERMAKIKERASGPVDIISEAEKAVDNELRMRVIGEVGARRMDDAVEATTMMDNLAVAKEMEEAGKDAKAIKMATGWERGADNLWRYEMEDFEFIGKPGRKKTFKLSDLIADLALFTAYPELKDIKVKYTKLAKGKGGEVATEKGETVIRINEDQYRAQNPVVLKAAEEFAKNHPEIAELVSRGRTYAMTAEQREIYLNELKKPFIENEPYINEFGGKGTLVHEIQHVIQDIENFAQGGNSAMVDTSDPVVRNEVETLQRVLGIEIENANELVPVLKDIFTRGRMAELSGDRQTALALKAEWNKKKAEWDNHSANINAIKKDLRKFKTLGLEGYRKLAGEVESRNAEARMNMSYNERRNSLLSETEDVAREDQIFLRDNVMMKGDEYMASQTLVPGHKKGQPMLSDAEMMADVSFRITKNTKSTIETWFNKAGVDVEMTEATINYLDYAFEDATEQLCAAKWYLGGKINLPGEDDYKVRDAVKVAKTNKVDALLYDSPMAIIYQFGKPNEKQKPINPDTVPTLKNKQEVPGTDIVIYDVEESEESRKNMREIINTHYGKNASPWCVLQGDEFGQLTPEAKEKWEYYSAYPKQVAFKNGRLLAFSANSEKNVTWWDRLDKPFEGIPVMVKLNDAQNRRASSVINPKTGKQIRIADVHSRTEKDGYTIIRNWDSVDGPMINAQKRKGDALIAQFNRYTEEDFSTDLQYWLAGRPNGLDQVYTQDKTINFSPNGALETYNVEGYRLAYNRYGRATWLITTKTPVIQEYGFNRKGKLVSFFSGKELITDKKRLAEVEVPEEYKALVGRSPKSFMAEAEQLIIEAGLAEAYEESSIRFRVTAEQDKAYMDAVNAGDMETAQRMVLEAAKLAMPNTKVVDENGNPKVVYHGTGSEFYTFRETNDSNELGAGYYFSDSYEMAERYATDETLADNRFRAEALAFDIFTDEMGHSEEDYDDNEFIDDYNESYVQAVERLFGNGHVKSVFLNLENPRIMSRNSENFDPTYRYGYNHYNEGAMAKRFNDGIIDEMFEERHEGLTGTQYVAFNPSQIKSAEPVTYDNDGKVIPLSERFNPENADIRFRFTPRTDEQREQLFDKAKAHYGLTKNFNASGYMLPDGSLLDFSESNDGGDPNRRSLDHRDVEGIIMDEGKEYDSRYHYVVDFVDEGAIRMLPEAAGFQLSVPPTAEQRSRLMDYIYKHNGEVIMEITDEKGSPRVYMEYNRRTSPSRVFSDMDRFFNEGVVPGIPPLRFRIANDNQAIFVSNAAKTVEGIKQEKATPEQWLKMIEKNGGLKAGEDKWMGLSDWLKSSDKKTLTKQEVLDFINENMIVIEEQHYSNEEMGKASVKILNERYQGWEDAFSFEWDGYMEEPSADISDYEAAVELYNKHHDDKVALDEDGEFEDMDTYEKVRQFGVELSEIYHGSKSEVRPIDGTREQYTTQGLQHLHEIALTVPTIESWGLGGSNTVHFEDAGEGRAVAWIRFGDASKWVPEQREDGKKGRTKKVLVIDEIQSKRHQEGREKGYATMSAAEFSAQMNDKYGTQYFGWQDKASPEEWEKYRSLSNAIPDAPFEKNWHELAMKRMLRYAAENGYDVIAWTKGDQQAERYGIGGKVDSISSTTTTYGGNPAKEIFIDFKNHAEEITIYVDANGNVVDHGEYEGRNLGEIIGKELAVKLLAEDTTLSEDGLLIGGEGMRGFYDKMLPAFMNKYGKKWGIKVEDINLPHLEDGLTMHSVPVTEEMKASVMEGQVMFRTTQNSWDAPLTAEERAKINEFFPGFSKINSDIRTSMNSLRQELTPDQQAFFANSKAVDKDGNLLVLYHGTPRAGFTEFKSGWFTTSKEDAISYSGDRKGRMFDPNEKYEPETLTAGDFRLGYMTFDSEEDRAAFLERFPYADEVMSEREYEDARMGAEDEEYDVLTARREEFAEVWNAYREYERERFVDTTIGDLVANPEAYTEEDFMRAMLEYDSNASLDSLDDMDAAERKDALVSALQNANEETDGGIFDMVVPTRVPRNGEGLKHNDLGNRTYEVYANIENPYEIDANGRGSEFESGDIYKAVEEALADEQYDGIIIRNWRVGRTQQLGDVVVPKDGSQIKLTSNENPMESDDIRFRTTDADENGVRFKVVTDPAKIEELEDGPKVEAYRAVQIDKNGKIFSPMASRLKSTKKGTKQATNEAAQMNQWDQAVESLDKVDENGKITILDEDGGTTKVAYNPYGHCCVNSMMNDQFKRAWERDGLYVMKVLAPESELTAGYHAEKAKDAVGIHKWKTGAVGNKLPENKRREILLTRWMKNVKVMPWEAVAQDWIDTLDGENIDVPFNVVPRKILNMLTEAGVKIVAPEKGMENAAKAYEQWLADPEGYVGNTELPDHVKALNEETDDEGPDNEPRFRTTGTPTDEVVTNGLQLTPAQTAEVAANIFAALPEESRKKITEGLNGNVLGLKDAILQIPASLASKENWNEEDRQMAAVVRDVVQDLVDANPTTRPLTTKEALWMLYDSTNTVKDLVDAASRAFVAYNLGFDPASMQRKQEVSDYLRFRTASNGAIDAATDMYNYETSLWTERLKESWLDMNQSVVSLQKAMAEASGMPIEPWENLEFALNRLSSKSYADKKKYLRDFLMPMWDTILDIVKHDNVSIEEIERYMMLKHGLERNRKFASRDAKDYYRTMYDLVAERMKNQSHAQKVVALSEAKNALAAIDAQIAVASSSQLPRLNEARAKAQYDVEVADLVLRGDETQNEAELQAYYDAIDNEADPKYREFREKDYGGLTSMFVDTTEVQRSKYKSEEAYQKAVLAATTPKFDKVADMEAEAEAEVDAFENKVYMYKALWDKVNAATKETLRHQYETGMITIEQYEAVRDMFEFYVPLRGFADNTAEDMYSYYMNNSAGGFTKPILGAKGRKTRAESPLGWIGTMAESAIQSDNKNQAKMALYYMTLRRPDQNLLTITETWYEYTGQKDANGKKIFKAAYPPATDRALNADELRQHMEDWEDDMRKKQSRGEAYKGSQRVDLKGSVVFQDEKEEKEHVVRVKVAGKDYSILINGNPRAAQAINGLLNPDANVGPVAQWIGDVRRNLSALLTSYSPLFWVANYQRDLLASTMRVSEADGWDMAMKYLANRRHAWRVASYVYKYDAGELGDSYYENLYREFAENGGITGYTSLTTNKEYEKLLEDYAKNVDRKVLNAVKGAFDKFMGFGEAIEQVTRFAAYITARESGKSIEEAVNAAKEVSVNFNRKGSAKPISLDELEKLRTKDGKKLNMAQKTAALVLSAMPGPMKFCYYFVNASIQALSSSAKLAKKSPGKATTWVGMYMGTSIALAMLNYLLSDDDDDEYLNLPDYLRHSTALIKIADGYYFKWSIPQEMRPFYAWADILVRKMMGKMPHKSGKEVGKEMALAASQWLPVNPFDAEDPLLSVIPDFLSPLAEIRANTNAFGGKIYNDMAFKSESVVKEIPAYRKATEKTGAVYVDIAEFLNDISGGDEVIKGKININPSIMEHLIEGYGGGIYDFAKMMVSIPSMILSDDPVQVKEIPFVNKVILSVDETNMYSHTNEAFRHYKDVADNAKRVEKEYRESDDPSRADAYCEEEDWRIYLLYKEYEKDFKDVKERLDNAVDKEEQDLLKQEQNVLREMFLDDIAKGDVPEVTFQIREDVKRFDKEIKAIMKPVTDANKERLEKRRAGDVDGMLKAIERRDSLKDTPEYQKADELNEDLKKIKQQLKDLGTVQRGSQRDSVIGELQKNYDAIVRKMEQL